MRRSLLATCTTLAILSRAAPAEASDPVELPAAVPSNPNLFFHPAGPGRGRVAMALGLIFDEPLYSTQDFLPIVPQAEVRMRFGLPRGFSLAADFTTLFIQNDLTMGVSWSTPLPELPRVAATLKLSAGALFGGLSGFGFETFVISPEIKPAVTIGWAMGDSIRFSISEELTLTRWQMVANGGSWATNQLKSYFAASTSLFMVENLLARGGNIYFGAGAVVARAPFSLWLLFSQQTTLILYPRLTGGYVF